MSEEIPNQITNKPIFAIDLETNGGLFTPNSADDIDDFLSQEIEFWGEKTRNPYQNTNVTDPLRPHINKLITLRNRLQKTEESELKLFASELLDVYSATQFPHSKSMTGERIREYKEKYGDAVEHYIRILVAKLDDTLLTPRTAAQWRAMLRGAEHRFALAKEDTEGMSAIMAAFDNATHRVQAEQERLHGISEHYRKEAESNDSACKSLIERHKNNLTESKDKHIQLTGEHLSEMDRIRKTFKEEMGLRAPSTYWSSKQEHHRKMSIAWGLLTALLLLLSVSLLWNKAKDFLEPTPIENITMKVEGSPNPIALQTTKATADPTPVIKEALRQDAWRLGVFALMAIFGFWAVRLVVRMFLSHLHLHTDASERMVMLQTYLALMEADKLADKDDRALILQALFRPASDGIVKDEAAPPSIGEWLTRTGKA